MLAAQSSWGAPTRTQRRRRRGRRNNSRRALLLSAAAAAASSAIAPAATAQPFDDAFCGRTWDDASSSCSARRHCPAGSSDQCPPGHTCFTNTKCSAAAGHGVWFQNILDRYDVGLDAEVPDEAERLMGLLALGDNDPNGRR